MMNEINERQGMLKTERAWVDMMKVMVVESRPRWALPTPSPCAFTLPHSQIMAATTGSAYKQSWRLGKLLLLICAIILMSFSGISESIGGLTHRLVQETGNRRL